MCILSVLCVEAVQSRFWMPRARGRPSRWDHRSKQQWRWPAVRSSDAESAVWICGRFDLAWPDWAKHTSISAQIHTFF